MADHDSERKSMNRWQRILSSETGQMSVFIALMFQVLFVFFAMTINIGLLVHDKINLQNAVDLGAYYGAQRQAELLNEIAHINYQIRQDFKLLTWRYRVLGTLGRHYNLRRMPPQTTQPGTALPDDLLSELGVAREESPVVCVANEFWWEWSRNSTQLENYCYQSYGSTTPAIPSITVIAPFIPGLGAAINRTNLAQLAQNRSCNNAAAMNWAFTMQMLYAYKLSIAVRKLEMRDLKRNLVAAGFRDLENQSVKDGIRMTVKKNLTKANEDTLANDDVEFINGLSLGQCASQDGDFLLPEVLTAPLLNFMWTHSGGGAGCNYDRLAHTQANMINEADRRNWDPGMVMENISYGEPPPNDPHHSSLGFEKNPWCMAYVGVKASTAPRKPFAPFGPPIRLQARAFAQPFGGRIGPWYTGTWNRGAGTSDLGGPRIDPLTPPRLMPGSNIQYSIDHFPNYSRFPGDQMGLRSQLAMGAQRHIFSRLSRQMGRTMRLAFFAGFGVIPFTGDPLMYDVDAQDGQEIDRYDFGIYRKAEMAAVMPDLFDATYYSIDPSARLNYHNRNMRLLSERFPSLMGLQARPAPDIGARNDHAGLQNFQVEDQISFAWSDPGGALDPSLAPQLYYPLRTWDHLLTGWGPPRTNQYNRFPDERFGRCTVSAPATTMIPGRCAVGGRVGYSVRLVSRNHLLGEWNVGGAGVGPAPLMNPPDPTW